MLRKTSVGFHTICVFWKITREDASDLLHIFGNIKGVKTLQNIYNKNHYDVYYTGKNRGVRWKIRFDEYKYRDKDGVERENKQYYIEAVINPKIVTGETDYITAANETYIEPMIKAYNKIAVNISPKLPLFQYCALKEIHYCINFHLGELHYPYAAEELMDLLKKGYIPPAYEELKYRCERQHKLKSVDHSFYLISKSVVVNCYDKQAQLRKKQIEYPYRDYISHINAAEGIIRFEIQCKYHKINNMLQYIKTHYNANYKHPYYISFYDILKILLSDAVARKMVYDYFSRIIGLGDYHTLSRAKEKVLASCNSPKAERLIAALDFINEKRGIHKALDVLDANTQAAKNSEHLEDFSISMMKINNFHNSLRELNKLNINPVTLPLSTSRNYKTSSIPNLLRVYLFMNDISEEKMKIGMAEWPAPKFHSTMEI